ncbi:pyridoxamine 5'-phosphate oxidase family protein, partial [Achromobacter sp. MYb9]|uniref:pyridoxamine 5'-phosphate oxidase family protein n=1 Tax=Achromobacter sp. MYb9 TaxID=1827284 RepID=UPI0011B1DA7E
MSAGHWFKAYESQKLHNLSTNGKIDHLVHQVRGRRLFRSEGRAQPRSRGNT